MKALRLHSIRTMLIAIVAFATVLAVAIGALAHLSLNRVRDGGNEVVERAKPAIALGTTRTTWAEFTSITAGKINTNSTDGKNEADRAAAASYQQLQADLKAYLGTGPGAEQRDLVENKVIPSAAEAWQAWTDKVKPLTDVVNPDASALMSYATVKANSFDTPAYIVTTALQQVADLDAKAIDERIASAEDTAKAAVVRMWIIAGIGAALILFLGVLLMLRITRPLRRTVDVLEQVAGGDLTPRLQISTPSELAQMADALNTTLSTVHDVIEAIEGDAERLYEVAERVSEESGSATSAMDSLSRGVRLAQATSETLTREVGQLAGLATAADLAAAIDRIAGQVEGLRTGVSGPDLAQAFRATAGEDDSQASADLASMAGNLNAMISLFVLRSPASDEVAG